MKIKKNALIVISFGILMILVSSSCGEKYPITKSSDGYTFQVDENQNATLIKADSYSEVIEVPQTIDSYKVIKLGCVKKAALIGYSYTGIFEYNDIVKEIIIPEGLLETYGPAIANCDNLERISIPSTMTRFSVSRCNNLKEINIADGNKTIEDFSFDDSHSLVSIVLPKRMTKLTNNAFARCYSLKNIKMSNSICSIGSWTFQDCSSLKTIDLPTELSKIGGNAFQRSGLKSISIPQNVTEIQCWTFESCESLKTVQLSESITNIFDGAFQNCYSLERIDIYEKCSYIAENAFEGCNKLTIYGIKRSYAEKYAKEHSIPFVAL